MKKIEQIKQTDELVSAFLSDEHGYAQSCADDNDPMLDGLLDAKVGSGDKAAGDLVKCNRESSNGSHAASKTDDTTELERIIEKLSDEFNDDVMITIGNLREKSQMESAIKGKWNSKLTVEKYRGSKLKKKLDELCAGLEKMYSESRSTPSGYLNSRRATDGMLANNSDVRMLRRAIEDNKVIVDYLERCWCAIQGFGYTIKNSIESAKLEMGI